MTFISSFFRHSRSVILATALWGLRLPGYDCWRGVPDGFADLAERLMPAVVNISTSQTVDTSATRRVSRPLMISSKSFSANAKTRKPQPPQSVVAGSGFVIDPEGIIVTNNHVIEEADEIVVNFSDGSKYDATVVGRDPKTDIAFCK